jgi:sigma-70-like protein
MNASDRMPGEDDRGSGEREPARRDEPPSRGDSGSHGGLGDFDPGDAVGDFEDDVVTEDFVRVAVCGDGDVDPPATSLKLRRHRRTRPRGTTIAMKRVSLADLAPGAALYPPVDLARPRTRADCGAEARPCPWVACKHHLYLDINPETGSIKINFPDREPWELEHTCALDVADAGAKTLDEIGEITNLTRERIRQVEVRGLLKLRTRRELR